MKFWRRLQTLLPSYRARQEKEMQEELDSLKAMAEKNELGNLTMVAENARTIWQWNWLEMVWREVRYSLRSLRKTPGFTISAIIILSAGIGLNLAFFQFINVVFLKPAAVRDPSSLVHVTAPAGESRLNYAAMQFLKSSSKVFSTMLMDMRVDARTAANNYADPAHRLEWEGTAKSPSANFVSANWFEELGSKALQGRLFSESSDAGSDALPVAVISQNFWETHLLGDPDVIGSAVRITKEGRTITIIGVVARYPGNVLGAGFEHLNQPDLWIPVEHVPYLFPDIRLSEGAAVSGRLYGRLKSGVSLRAATAALEPLLDELAQQQPRYRENKSVALFSGSTNFRQSGGALQIVAIVGGVGSFAMLVLVIACSNLTNLVLSRTVGRIQELSVRVSLGASRARILLQLLTETALIAILASSIGLLIADLGMRVTAWRYPVFLALDLRLDWRTMAMAMAGAIVMTAVVGLFPAWTIGKRDLGAAMKDGGQQTSSSLVRIRHRRVLLAIQVAGSCLLLVVTGFMLRTLQHEMKPPTFQAENVLVFKRDGLEREGATAYWKNLRQYVAQQPGIESVALSENWPSATGYRQHSLEGLDFDATAVDPDFFRILRIPFLTGKSFEPSDSDGDSIILSKSLAMQAFGTINAAGRPLPPFGRVAGVVDNVRLSRYGESERAKAYVPLTAPARLTLLARARTSADAAKLLFDLPKTLRQFDSRIPDVSPLQRNLPNDLEEMLPAAAGLSLLATLGLIVASMGIFGVVSYGVTVRRKEIGIRLALGALDRSIVLLMVRQLIWPVSLAIVVGLIGGLAVGLAFASDRMFAPPEAWVAASALLLLLATIALACVIPTVRALRDRDIRVLSS